MSACAPTTEVGSGIVSTSLCGDTYVLAGGGEIAALSWQSDGPLSRASGNYLKASSDPEVLVAMQPEVLVLGPGEVVREGLLEGSEIISLDWVESWEGVIANTNKVPGPDPGPPKSELGGPGSEAGDLLSRSSILYLSRSGGTAGPGTYVDVAITAAGGRNIVEQSGWFTPDPEWIVAQNPDVVVTSFFEGYESVNAGGLRNKAVVEFIADRTRVDVPGALWPCAGPGMIDAVELIAEAIEP